MVKRRLEWEAVLPFQYFFEVFLRNEEKFHYFAKAWGPSIKPGTWNIPEHFGTFRNIPEHEIFFYEKMIN